MAFFSKLFKLFDIMKHMTYGRTRDNLVIIEYLGNYYYPNNFHLSLGEGGILGFSRKKLKPPC